MAVIATRSCVHRARAVEACPGIEMSRQQWLVALTDTLMTPLLSTSAAQKAPSGSSAKPRTELVVVTRSKTLTSPSPLASPGVNAQLAGGDSGGDGGGGGSGDGGSGGGGDRSGGGGNNGDGDGDEGGLKHCRKLICVKRELKITLHIDFG